MKFNRKKFYDLYRNYFGNIKKQKTVDNINVILEEFEKTDIKIKPLEKFGYILATVKHECGPDMIPITESLRYSAKRLMQVWSSRFPDYNTANRYSYSPRLLGNYVYGGRLGNGTLEGYKYRGRGFVQITGYNNYKKFGIEEEPDLALDPERGSKILIEGMLEGLFTGRKLKSYINGARTDYVNARRVVNADVSRNGAKIATDAKKFKKILDKSLY